MRSLVLIGLLVALGGCADDAGPQAASAVDSSATPQPSSEAASPTRSQSNIDSYADLLQAANAAGFGCNDHARLSGEDAWDQLRMSFDGLTELGACWDDAGTHYLVVFADEASLGSFIDTQAWIGFESFLAPVSEGRTFAGVAGENWLITNYIADGSFLDAIDARPVESQQASVPTQD